MIGIIFFACLIFLVIFIFWFAKWCTYYIKPGMTKFWSYIAVVFTCYMALIGDEIIGGIQFGYLCYNRPSIEVLVDELEGRKVRLHSERNLLSNTLLEISKGTSKAVDVDTNEVVIQSMTYRVDGGWLSHWIDFNGHANPFFFDNSCGPGKKFRALMKTHNIKDVDYTKHHGQ
ncbi:hypothetical protein BEL05_08585 [Shewanella colwelliana]|uniref:Uncharacterized protein n=1 Tax=Shewanella colwelliana TaxID=23 RepID=A0A1E5IZC9_SHECO|nr:hypothetical protein [Shewanella colwelliana]OEG75478.1 hypothetical protein BEL05_08585 [Shewanella colwelliana]